MSRSHLTGADEIYIGRGYLAGANPENRPGMKATFEYFQDGGVLAAALADGIIKDATSTSLPDAAGTVTYDASTDGTAPQDATTRPAATTINVSGVTYPVLDIGAPSASGFDPFPRNIVSVVTHGSAVVALTIKHYGFDINKKPMTETHTITAGTTSKTVTGKKAFRYWWKTDITAAADASANTVNIGTGNIFGLKYRATSINYFRGIKDGDVDASATVVAAVTTDPATTSTGDVRGTIDFNSDPNGTAEYAVIIKVRDTSSATALHGVTQA